MTTERRTVHGAELRAVTLPDGAPGVVLQAITPNIVDDYGSVFTPDCFDRSLSERAPVLCWSHDWSDPIGHATGHTTGDAGPRVSFAFDDFDAVPQARRAHAQVASGTITDCSVGFSNTKRRDPTADEEAKWPGCREVIFDADLDEVSLVLRGAVPGAKVVAYRSGERVASVPIDAVTELARKVNAGEISEDEAQTALGLLAVDVDNQDHTDGNGTEGDGDGGLDPVAVEADAAADAAAAEALDSIARSRLR